MNKFNVGDKVTFTNDAGISYPDKTITKLDTSDFGIEWGPRYFYTPSDSPWFSVNENQLARAA